MKNKVKIKVMLTNYVYGQDKQYTSDMISLVVDEKTLNDKVLLQEIIKDYCVNFARVIIPYDMNSEEYILSFWLDDDIKIKSVLLNDYTHLFKQNMDYIKIAD